MNMKRILFICILMLCSVFATFAQEQRTVTGKVTDELGEALPGVTIRVKGSQVGTNSNTKGDYSIKVASGTKTLVFSSVGFKTTEVAVNNRASINVILSATTNDLNEVVVIGYGKAKRSEITTSISSISEKEIKNLPVAGIDQAMQGKVAGVTISSNGGQPGGGISVRVRGITSVNGNEPLYVIDGVPMQGSRNSISQDQLGGQAGQNSQSPLAALNPNDIVSIDVLKDASAQAIYGSRAANGVVVITTKSGKIGESKISYEVYYGQQTVPKKLSLLNLSQFAAYQNSLAPEINSSGIGFLTPIEEFADPSVLGAGTNWQDAVFRKGIIKNHQLAFSGGQNKTSYYFSVNYFGQEGTVIGSDFERFALRTSIDHQVKSWFKAGISLNASRANQRITLTDGSSSVIGISVYNSPATPVTSAGGYATQTNVGGSAFGNPINPVALAELRNVRSLQTKLFGSLYGDISLTKWLTLRNELNYDFTVSENTAFQPYITNTATGETILGPSKLQKENAASLYWGLKTFLTFDKSFGKHYLNVLVGHEAASSTYETVKATRNNLTLNLQSLAAGSGTNQVGEGASYPWAMESFFGRANYLFNNKYSVTASLRRDGSSAFGPQNKWGYFPAVSAGWTVSNEPFMKNISDVVGYMKVRAGYGSVGNSSTGGNNVYATNINLVAISPLGNGSQIQNVGNPTLQWESVITKNLGVDLSFFNKKVDLTVDVYNKETSKMLLKSKLPVFAGLATNSYDAIQPPVTNSGRMTNTGIDIALTTYNVDKGDFSWKTNVVFSRYQNVLNELTNTGSFLAGYKEYGDAVQITQTMAGGPVGSFYGLVTDGLFRSQEELKAFGAANSNNQLGVSPTGIWLGDVRYKDVNGDGVINSSDMTVIGNPNPDFTYGMTNTFKYKNLDLSLFLTGSQGGQILNYTRRSTEMLSNAYQNQSTAVLDRYTEANPNGSLPRFNMWNGNNFRMSDRFVEDGSYMRIQNITIGYNLPKALIAKAKLASARLYFSAQNLKTFTNYSGYDPELGAFNGSISYMNVDDGHYPNPRTFTIGGNFEF